MESASSCGPQANSQPEPPMAQAPKPTDVISRLEFPSLRVSIRILSCESRGTKIRRSEGDYFIFFQLDEDGSGEPPHSKTNGALVEAGRRCENRIEFERELNGFACCRRRRRGAGESVGTRFLFRSLVNLDGAFEVGAVFDHDAGSGEVTVD